LRQIAGAIESGLDIRGYYHWSLIDNFEWIKGFGPRFGLFAVNYETFARTERPSAEIYRTIVKSHEGGKPRVDLLVGP
jgi:beta-glucosidase